MSEAPFCYVAEKAGRWHGVTSGDYEVTRFYSDFTGYTIRTIATRDEWRAYLKAVPAFRGRET